MSLPTHDDLVALVQDQIDERRKAVGMVVGVADADGQRIVAHGTLERDVQRPVTSETVFELASVTKVFVAVLLSDMVERGEVSLDDPVERHLPSGSKVPQRNGRQITLIDLATHTSGLPPQPYDFPTLDHPAGATYSREQLYSAVAAHHLTRDIGTEWEYGNVDFALLAHALAHRAGTDFETLVSQRISGPLGLTSTTLLPSGDIAARLASGHDSDLHPRSRPALGALAPAGGMLSSAGDLLTLARALLDLAPSPLNGRLPSMLAKRRSIRPPICRMLRKNWRLMLRMMLRPPRDAKPPVRYFTRAEAALGWFVFGRESEELVIHDGAGPSGAASLALDPHSRTAVVVLSNTGQTVHDISRHLLRRDFPLYPARQEVAVDPPMLDRYVGQYEPQEGVLFDVRRDGDRLTVALPVIGRVRLRAENERDFFVSEMPFEFRFTGEGPHPEMLFRPTPALPMFPVKRVN